MWLEDNNTYLKHAANQYHKTCLYALSTKVGKHGFKSHCRF